MTTELYENVIKQYEGEHKVTAPLVKVYEGSYIEETGCFDAYLENQTLTYYCVYTSNIAEKSFDFEVITVPVVEGKVLSDQISGFVSGTAYFIEDGKKAYCHEKELYFLFGDDQINPIIGEMKIEGIEELENKIYLNNSIPGHEAG